MRQPARIHIQIYTKCTNAGVGEWLGLLNPNTPRLVQGEEADIVIASLVRSNARNQLGFLGKADAQQR